MSSTEAPSALQMETRLAEAGKYLTFILANESYGLEILKVREIIGVMAITPVPQTPVYVKGVINLRGRVIPVVDLRVKFGMVAAEQTDETCIIVVDIGEMLTGILVDNVDEVLDILGEDIEEAPDFGAQVSTDFILGVAKTEGSVKILLDIDQVLSSTELGALAEVSTETATEIAAETTEDISAEAVTQDSPVMTEEGSE